MPHRSSNASEWENLALNPKTDTPLYLSHRNSSKNGFPISRGTDLFVHRAPSGTLYFYLFHWSNHSNETNICQIISKDSARNIILEYMGQKNHNIANHKGIRILEYYSGII